MQKGQATYHDPNDPESTITFNVNKSGDHFLDGEQVPQEYWQRLTPYDPGQTGSSAKAIAKAEDAAAKAKDSANTSMLDADQATMIITDPKLRQGGGAWYEPDRWATKFGLTDEGVAAQGTQTRMSNVGLTAVSPQLAKLGVNPTDKDLAEAFKTAPGVHSEPETWLDWYKNTYMPQVQSALNRYSVDPDVAAEYMSQMETAYERGVEIQKKEEDEDEEGMTGWSIIPIDPNGL